MASKVATQIGEHLNEMLAEAKRAESMSIGARSMGSQLLAEMQAMHKTMDAEENVPVENLRYAKFWLGQVAEKLEHLVAMQRAKVYEQKGAADALDRAGTYVSGVAHPKKPKPLSNTFVALNDERAAAKKAAKKSGRKKASKKHGANA